MDAEWAAKKALRECDLFLAIGTSGTVSPASNFVRSAKYAGAWTLLVNCVRVPPGERGGRMGVKDVGCWHGGRSGIEEAKWQSLEPWRAVR
jgi:hypothetical protein